MINSPRTLILLSGLLPFICHGQPKLDELEDGRIVRIDPATKTATIYSDKGAQQLWDGTHRLDDGSVIIVKEGVVISEGRHSEMPDADRTPTEGGSPAAQPSPVGKKVLKEASCVELAVKVCGFDGECSDSPACSPARQLVELEKEEAWSDNAPDPNLTTLRCQQALENETYFAPCTKKPQSPTPTPCEKLVEQACGVSESCADAPACDPARQLLKLEMEERIEKNRRPERTPVTSKRCTQAMSDDFFAHCDADDASPEPTETPPPDQN